MLTKLRKVYLAADQSYVGLGHKTVNTRLSNSLQRPLGRHVTGVKLILNVCFTHSMLIPIGWLPQATYGVTKSPSQGCPMQEAELEVWFEANRRI